MKSKICGKIYSPTEELVSNRNCSTTGRDRIGVSRARYYVLQHNSSYACMYELNIILLYDERIFILVNKLDIT